MEWVILREPIDRFLSHIAHMFGMGYLHAGKPVVNAGHLQGRAGYLVNQQQLRTWWEGCNPFYNVENTLAFMFSSHGQVREGVKLLMSVDGITLWQRDLPGTLAPAIRAWEEHLRISARPVNGSRINSKPTRFIGKKGSKYTLVRALYRQKVENHLEADTRLFRAVWSRVARAMRLKPFP